ncbi:MAG: sulfatase-like hydrolase/transferase [Planctomycetota bacterium]
MKTLLTAAVICLTWTGLALGQETDEQSRPNVLIILADDLGSDDVGINNPLVSTPHLDALARESARLTQFGVMIKCAPTRAALLTGKSFQRVGVWGVHGGRDFLGPDELTIAEVFQDAGYDTGMVGKWHSGLGDRYYPWDRGFDIAHIANLYRYLPEERAAFSVNGEATPMDDWAQNQITEAAIDFIRVPRDNPYFMYVAFMAPHSPWRSPEEYQQPYRDAGLDDNLAAFYGMVTFMDHQIGRLLEAVDENADDTIVLFLSDNGPAPSGGARPPGVRGKDYATRQELWRTRNPNGLRGGKGVIFENGTRSVLFVRYPDAVPAAVHDEPAVVMDLFPTLAELAGLDAEDPAFDGVSLAELLTGQTESLPERDLFFGEAEPKDSFDPWRPRTVQRFEMLTKTDSPDRFAFDRMTLSMRRGSHKFIHRPDGPMLFDLSTDPRERRPMDDPELTAALEEALRTWWSGVLESPVAFERPTQFIDAADGVPGIVQLRAATRANGVAFSALDTFEWDQVGDKLEMDVTVGSAGTFRVTLIGEAKAATNGTFRITFGADGPSVDAVVDQPLRQIYEHPIFGFDAKQGIALGEVELPAGEMTITVELIGLDRATAVDSLNHLVFERTE